MLTASLHTALPDGGVPEWVHLVPSGTFRGEDGRGPYRLTAPGAVIAASMAAKRLPIDENHAIDRAPTTGVPSPARGWIDRMEARPDGIWGHVEWTPTGHVLMTEHAYRGISPAFFHDKSGVVLRIVRAALTNTPNLSDLATLHTELSAEERDRMAPELFAVPAKKELPIRDPDHVRLAWDMVDRTTGLSAIERRQARGRILARARQLGIDTRDWDTAATAAHTTGDDMDPTALRAALGLPETADDAAILAAVTANAAAVTSHSQQLTAIAAAAGLTATAAPEIVTALQTARATAGEADGLATQVVSLQTQLQTLQASAAKGRATAFIDGAITAGKPIVPLRDRYITRHMADAEGVEAEINALPSIHGGGVVIPSAHAQGGAEDEDPLTDQDKAVAKQMGFSHSDFAKGKKRLRVARENRERAA